MSISYLCRGQSVNIDGKGYQILREVETDVWQLENIISGQLRLESTTELHKLYSETRLHFYIDNETSFNKENKPKGYQAVLDTLPKKQKKEAKNRYAYVSEIKRENLTIFTEWSLQPLIDRIWHRLGRHGEKPHWTTVYRWWSAFSQGGYDIRSLVSKHNKKGNHERRYPDDVLRIVEKSINSIYMTRERNTVQDVYDDVTVKIKKYNSLQPDEERLDLPKPNLVKSTIRKIPAYDKEVARYGYTSAQRKFRAVLSEVTADSILDRVEIDHTRLDVFVLDDENFLPLGRPWITACIDVRSRSILGIYIGFEPPSHLSVARCLREAFLPKTNLKEKYPSIENEWICYGVMQTLVVDNGLEFHGDGLEDLCNSLGIIILYTPRKMPWFKAKIERFFGTLNRGVAHGIPGTTFHNILEKDDYDAADKATVTLSTLQEIVRLWITDYYHQKPHSALGRSPNDVWLEDAKSTTIPLVSDPNDLDFLLGRVTTRTVTHKGVELNSLFYNSRELRGIRLKHGDNISDVKVRYDDGDLGEIYVIEPNTSKAIKVPAIRYDYAKGLTSWQHKLYRKFAKKYLKREDIEALAMAKEKIRELVAKDFFNKKTKTRVKMARYLNGETISQLDQKPIDRRDVGSQVACKSNDTFEDIVSFESSELPILSGEIQLFDSEIDERHI